VRDAAEPQQHATQTRTRRLYTAGVSIAALLLLMLLAPPPPLLLPGLKLSVQRSSSMLLPGAWWCGWPAAAGWVPGSTMLVSHGWMDTCVLRVFSLCQGCERKGGGGSPSLLQPPPPRPAGCPRTSTAHHSICMSHRVSAATHTSAPR
jgi:hypothetical protein